MIPRTGQGLMAPSNKLYHVPVKLGWHLQKRQRFRVAGGNPLTNQATWRLAGPGKDSYIRFPDWSDGVTSANAKKKKKKTEQGGRKSASLVQLSPLDAGTEVPDWVTTSAVQLTCWDSDSFDSKCHGRQLASSTG